MFKSKVAAEKAKTEREKKLIFQTVPENAEAETYQIFDTANVSI